MSRNRSHRLWIALLTVLCLVRPAMAVPSLEPRLVSFWDDWLSDVEPLLQAEEQRFLSGLENIHERERGIEAFWRSRGEEARVRWQTNRIGAAQLRPRSPEARRATLVFGKPASIDYFTSCGGLRALEVWRWDGWQIARQGGGGGRSAVVVLAQANNLDSRSYRHWDPARPADLGFAVSADETLPGFLDSIRKASCLPEALEQALGAAISFPDLVALAPWPRPGVDWTEALDLGALGTGYPARLQISFPGNYGRYTIVESRLRIPSNLLEHLDSGILFDRVTMRGDIYQRDRRVDSFEVVHHIAGTPPESIVELGLYRRLRAGTYRMDLRVTDLSGRALLRSERELVVPSLENRAPDPPGRVRGFERMTRSEVVLLETFPAVEVLPVAAKGVSRVEVRAITTGGPIAAVEFRLDGRKVSVDSEPPYVAEVALGSERPKIEALALDSEGGILARHARTIDRQRRPLAVRVLEPRDGALRAAVEISMPAGEQIAKVECFHGRRLAATPSEAPWECPFPVPPYLGLQYVRAKVTLVAGDTAEHLLFLGPSRPEAVDVRLVELFASVRDASGRLVTGLAASDFEILDGGEPRELLAVESLANLPISVAVLTDLSSSMGRLTELASRSAQRFFESTLVASDLGSLLAFNHDFHRLVPFTGDVHALRHGAFGLKGLGSTRLHDGVVWALSQFSGQENRRALVVLSDGGDVGSDFAVEQVAQAAVQAGVAVFPISLVRSKERPPESIERLADSTGGRSFTIHSVDQLDSAYSRIEQELRSQYLLTYRMPASDNGLLGWDLEVKVLRPGLAVRNVHGRYP